MKKIFILFLSIIVVALLYYGGYFSELISKASLELENVFVPSKSNIDQIARDSGTNYGSDLASKSFAEFSEQTIKNDQFYLRIDKVNLFKRIVQDVDPRYKDQYVESWNYGISHGKFTSTPDKIGITYLFAHAVSNTTKALDENAWFTYLDQLVLDDEIVIYYQGWKYTYAVSEIRFVKPDATGFYTGASSVSKVRLQFCGPPTGSLDSRTLVDAVLVNSELI